MVVRTGNGEELLLASSGWRPGRLPSILQCTGRPLTRQKDRAPDVSRAGGEIPWSWQHRGEDAPGSVMGAERHYKELGLSGRTARCGVGSAVGVEKLSYTHSWRPLNVLPSVDFILEWNEEHFMQGSDMVRCAVSF